MIAVIAGASGLVGSNVLELLLADNHFSEVISVSRRSLNLNHPKLKEVIISDLTKMSEQTDKLKGDIFICALGTTIKDAGSQENFKKVDYTAVLEFGKIAKLNNAKTFSVVSAYGASPESFVFYNKVKGQAEEALQSLHLNRLIIYKPSLLVGDRKVLRVGERLAVAIAMIFAPVLPTAIKKRSMTLVTDLAKKISVECQKTENALTVYEAFEI